jgi:hypothetical protein
MSCVHEARRVSAQPAVDPPAIFAIVAAAVASFQTIWAWNGSFAGRMILLGATIILITAGPVVRGTDGRRSQGGPRPRR